MNLVAVNNPKMAFVTVNNTNAKPSRAKIATLLPGNAYIMSGKYCSFYIPSVMAFLGSVCILWMRKLDATRYKTN